MGLLLVCLIGLLLVSIVFAFLDYMDFLSYPRSLAFYSQEAGSESGDTPGEHIHVDGVKIVSFASVFTFQGSLADITRCTEYSLNRIKTVLGKSFFFPKLFLFFQNDPQETQVPGC